MTLCITLFFRQIFVDIFRSLFYNFYMKKILTAFIIIFTSSMASAIDLSLKKDTNKPAQPEEFQNLTNEASVYYAENDIKNAQTVLLSIPEDKRAPQNWLLIGNILQDQGKIDEAIFMYKKAIETDNKFYKAYYNLGNIYLQTDKTNMAIEEYKKAIKANPEFAYAHYNLACAYIKEGKYSKAKFELYTATDLKNTVPEFYYNLAFVLKKLNKEKDAKKYLEYYNKLMEQNYVQGYNI